MTTKVTLYFHIGSGKTGTTTIQEFLFRNSAKFLELGVLYPKFEVKGASFPFTADSWQRKYFEDSDDSDDLACFTRHIEYCKENSLHTIVVSHEAFLVNWRFRIAKLAGKLDADVKIICYLRRQDHYLESIWKEWGHKFFPGNDLLASIDRKEWGGWGVFDWRPLLDFWSKNFGKENIIVRPYENQQLPDGLIADFLNAMGVVWPEKEDLSSVKPINVGFSRDVLEFLYLNRNFHNNQKDYTLYTVLNKALDGNFKKGIFDSYGILSPSDRIKLLEKYDASNRQIAREYLHREDDRLFYEPWPDVNEEWQPYEGFTVEQLTPILTKLIYNLYEQQKNLTRENHILRRQYESSYVLRIERFLTKLLHNLRIKKT